MTRPAPRKLAACLALLLSASLAACASASPRAGDEAADTAPAPFPAATLRAAIRPGRTYTFGLVAVGVPEHRVRMKFLEVGDEGAIYERTEWPVSQPGPAEGTMANATWDELESHARYPLADTVVTEADVAVPAGRFHGRLYTVTTRTEDGHTELTRAYFADDVPGPPVKTEVSRDGQVMMTMTLVAFEAGEAPAE